ncbi:MAG: hypothetical protein VW338_03580 [Rhodospirillaceae bacterium]|jgi:hypothetical protein
MLKRVDAPASWNVIDAVRSPFNPVDYFLQPDNTGVDNNVTGLCDLTANSMKNLKATGYWNNSGATYAYVAFAKFPFGGAGVA